MVYNDITSITINSDETRDSPFYNDIDAPMHQYDLPSRISCLNMLWTPPNKFENCFEEPKVIVLRSALTFLIMILILLICAIVVHTAYSA